MKKLIFILFALISAASFGQVVTEVFTGQLIAMNQPAQVDVFKWDIIPAPSIKISYFAVREMTDAEKISLAQYPAFLDYCKQTVRNTAAFRASPDSYTTLTTEAAAIKWAKDKLIAVGFANNPTVADPEIGTRFVFYSKGATFDLPTAPASDSALLAVWVSGNRFEEFVSKYFDYLGEGYNMSLTGN